LSYNKAIYRILATKLREIRVPGRSPVGATDKPVGATDKLVGATDKLVGATDKPVGATDKPVGATDKLVGATDKLEGATDKLVGATGKLVGATDERGWREQDGRRASFGKKDRRLKQRRNGSGPATLSRPKTKAKE
jgi:hypothetical protein